MAPAAEAVAPFGAAVRVTPDGCAALVADTGADGVTRGFAACNGWRYVQGSGRSWTTTSAPLPAAASVLDVSVESGTTWFVYSSSEGTFVRTRTAAGAFRDPRRLTTYRVEDGNAAVVAYQGRYLVVWSQNDGSGTYQLWEAHTLGGNRAPRRFFGTATGSQAEVSPDLDYQPATSRAVLAWSSGPTVSSMAVKTMWSTGGGWSRPLTVDSNGWSPTVAVEGSLVAVGYGGLDGTTCRCGGWVATGTTTAVSARRRVSGLVTGGARVALSAGQVAAAWQVYDQRVSDPPVRVAVRATSGGWTEASLGPSGNARPVVASVSGRLRVFRRAANHVEVRSQ